jgi:hypothetical protein
MTCPGNPKPYVMLLTHPTKPAGQYGVTAGQRVRLIFVEMPGGTIVIELYGSAAPGPFGREVAAAQAVIDTFRFGCGPSLPRPCGSP